MVTIIKEVRVFSRIINVKFIYWFFARVLEFQCHKIMYCLKCRRCKALKFQL